MSKPIALFVSSSPELQVEREIVGQVVATLPLTIGWRIGHTPMPWDMLGSQPAGDDVARVEQCDLYALILGHDFAAPMGVELRQAVARGISPLAFRKKCTPSPSAQDAIRRLDIEWRVFVSSAQLRQLFTRDLSQAMLLHATQLGLEVKELEGLSEWARQLENEPEEEPASRHHDAGRSGVILGREVWDKS
jgi:hypothetical protein